MNLPGLTPCPGLLPSGVGSCCCYSDFWPESADCLAHGLSLRVDAILILSKPIGCCEHTLHSYSDDATAEAAVERSLTADSGMKQRIDAEKADDPIFCAVVIWVVLNFWLTGVHWELDSVAVGLPEVDWLGISDPDAVCWVSECVLKPFESFAASIHQSPDAGGVANFVDAGRCSCKPAL
ncbi:hypothetical protein Nepgr_026622 [Nepenthes gracilis]|uniref:Uncharacterized protein n=1 Tax=Nepenthes gracilis TaxID=150966 RepID=A0AAD3Y293_NEPGR|nr:hypothetical protein Nepgr_026622 [Nepenthes gracilis]